MRRFLLPAGVAEILNRSAEQWPLAFASPQHGEPSRYGPSTRIIGHWLPLGKWSPREKRKFATAFGIDNATRRLRTTSKRSRKFAPEKTQRTMNCYRSMPPERRNARDCGGSVSPRRPANSRRCVTQPQLARCSFQRRSVSPPHRYFVW
jgi:hypothetical protein